MLFSVETQTQPAPQPKPSIEELRSYTSTISGESMEPWFREGQEIRVWKKIPENGDVMVFRCVSKKCVEENKTHTMLKFLKEKRRNENGEMCYWVEGRPDEWMIDGRLARSFDSRLFGWICGKEVKILGKADVVCENPQSS